MTTGSRTEYRNGLIVIAIGIVLLAIAFTDTIPFLSGGGGQTVTARFAQASDVDTATPVRVHGVDVGTVSALDAAPGNSTDVVMKLTTSVSLHRDASAQIRWRTLLGGSMYIDLEPGTSTQPLSGAIPISHTGTQVDWDQFNGQMPTATRPHFQQMLKGFDVGLAAPAAEGRTLHVLGPAAGVIGAGSRAARGTDIGDLPTLVKSTGQVLSALASDRAAVTGFVANGDGALAATASHNAQLAASVQLTPPALTATQTMSRTLNTTLTALDPLVVQLEPGARELGPTTTVLRPLLARTNTVLGDSVPLLQQATPAFRALGALGASGTPLIHALTPLTNRLNGNLLPWLGATDSETKLKLYEAVGPFFSALDDSLAAYDANGYTYNFNVQVGAGSIELPCDLGLSGTALGNLAACATAKAAIAHIFDGGSQ